MKKLLLTLIALGVLHSVVLGGEEKPKSNVIVILCDDLGYGELPVYRKLYQESDEFKTAIGSFTPHLDRLANEGVVCTRAYGNNHCVPARMSLLSGKWQTRKVVLGGQPMIGRAMREAGLKTAHFGKYHHEVEKTITLPYHPEFLEFDEFFGFEAMSDYFRKAGEVVAETKNSPITYRVGEKRIDYQFPKEGAYLTDTLTELGVDYINRCAREKQPFFLYLPYNAPHAPIQAKEADLRTLFPKQAKDASTRQKIMAMVYAVDRGIGRLVETLEKAGQLERTLILFTGDNGGEENLSLTYPMHGFKHEPFDGGIRVPYIVWSTALKASAEKPARYDGLVSLCDILPTALKYAALSTDLTHFKTDGIDLMPYLMGRKPPLEGRQYVNVRTLNHLSNTWDGGMDTEGTTIGSSITLLVDDFKIMKIWQDRAQKDQYSYQLQHLPDMVGKQKPRASLTEDYYEDNIKKPRKKEAMIKQLETLLQATSCNEAGSASPSTRLMKTHRFRTALSAILAILLVSLPAHAVDKPANEVAGEARLFKSADGSTMPYRIFTPKKLENGKTYPLVLCFHGAKGRGNDNQARGSLAYPVLTSAEMQRKHPAFIVAPQCPLGGKRWVNVNWSDGAYDSKSVAVSDEMTLALSIVDQLVAELPVDKTRIYVTGRSMGGFATWDAIARRPDYFAAAVPIAGGGDPQMAEQWKKLPI
ncbi:MAG: sulfatase-like hydrolase/transferase, partial [Verrucomicrobiae bacterium]|nr:sulfatase-like hydrolase/transferase [Verrucomicrobiae bacterium]